MIIGQIIIRNYINEGSSNYVLYANIIGTIVAIITGGYVYFTIKTFQEIKKQTDLQLNAHLSIEEKIIENIEVLKPVVLKSYIDNGFSNEWKSSMEKIFPDLSDPGILDGVYYCLMLSNYGNTEVKEIKLTFELTIENSDQVVQIHKLTPKETKKITRNIKEILRKGETINVPLFSIAAFPLYTIILTGTYTDVRNKTYSIPRTISKKENSYLQ